SAVWGGGLATYGSPVSTTTNVSFVDNVVDASGSGHGNYASVTTSTNDLYAFNTAHSGVGLALEIIAGGGGVASASYGLFHANVGGHTNAALDGTSILDVDPLLT